MIYEAYLRVNDSKYETFSFLLLKFRDQVPLICICSQNPRFFSTVYSLSSLAFHDDHQIPSVPVDLSIHTLCKMPSEDAKPVKKEEAEDNEDEISIGSLLQNARKKLNNATNPNGARVK